MNTTIGLVDDHQLFLKSLSLMLESFGGYTVVLEAVNGKELQQKIKSIPNLPEIMFIDVNMPEMNGIDTAQWLSDNYPSMRLVALSMNDEDRTIISMFKAGCCAYLLKDTHPTELERALKEIREKGYYNADKGNLSFRRLLLAKDAPTINITDRELEFLGLACSDLTYKAIAARMSLAERTIDGYRESLFNKFKVQSRVGLCLEAIRKGLVKP